MKSRTTLLLLSLFQSFSWITAIWGRPKKASPSLIFLKVPKGLMADVDVMETTIQQVETELDIQVNRIDVLRDPAAEALLNLFSRNGESMNPPILFHRDSLQCLNGRASVDQVRRLCQGRPVHQNTKLQTKPNAPAPVLLEPEEEKAMDQNELLEDLSLTDEQREGKRKMMERSKQRPSSSS